MHAYNDTDEYIAGFREEVQAKLIQIRTLIRKVAPEAEECISYGIPAFKIGGRPLIYFAGYRKHVSVYPAPRDHEDFKVVLAPYKGGRGTVQFSLDRELPLDLINRIVSFRLLELKKGSKPNGRISKGPKG